MQIETHRTFRFAHKNRLPVIPKTSIQSRLQNQSKSTPLTYNNNSSCISSYYYSHVHGFVGCQSVHVSLSKGIQQKRRNKQCRLLCAYVSQPQCTLYKLPVAMVLKRVSSVCHCQIHNKYNGKLLNVLFTHIFETFFIMQM